MTPQHTVAPSNPTRLAALVGLVGLLLLAGAGPATAHLAGFAASVPDPATGPGLAQEVSPDQDLATGRVVLSDGHVDLAPRFLAGQWRLLVHDGAARADAAAASVWRSVDDVVLHVSDAAVLTVPDDPAYAFLADGPGSTVHVVPQTQHPDVVWIGWNTQEPGVMAAVDRGVTFEVTRVEGPGSLVLLLQSGSFGGPQVLADSRERTPTPFWADVNTHTHASWVFSAPGVHLVDLRVTAALLDGTEVSHTATLRFVVGDVTDPALAFEPVAAEPADPADPAAEAGLDAEPAGSSSPGWPVLVALAGAAALLGGVGVALSGVQARRGARSEEVNR